MFKQLKNIPAILDNFLNYLKLQSKKELFFNLLLTGIIAGSILGFFNFCERVSNYGEGLSLLNKIIYAIFSTGLIAISGFLIALIIAVILISSIFINLKVLKIAHEEDRILPHLLVIINSMIVALIINISLVRFIIDPMNLSILTDSNILNVLRYCTDNLIYCQIVIFIIIAILITLSNYSLLVIGSIIANRKHFLIVISLISLALSIVVYHLTQVLYINQLFTNFKVTVLISISAISTFLFLFASIFCITYYLKNNYNKDIYKNKKLIYLIITFLVLFCFSIYGFNKSQAVRAFVYRYESFNKLVLCLPMFFTNGPTNYVLIPSNPGEKLKTKKISLTQESVNRRPNIFLIIVDSVNYKILVEEMKKDSDQFRIFSKESFCFENAYSQTTYTVGAISSLLSSKFFASKSDINYTTLPEILSQNGYETYCINYLNLFIDETVVKGKNYKSLFTKGFTIAQKVTLKDDTIKAKDDMVITKYFKDFLDSYNKEKPLFVYLHYMQLHLIPSSEVFNNIFSSKHFHKVYKESYDFENENLKLTFENIKKNDLYDNSIIILTADHGEELKEHGNYFHLYSLYQELTHIPLFIKMPKQKQSYKVQTSVSSLDIMPTLLNYIGYDYKTHNLNGRSILPLLENKKIKSEPIFSTVYMFKMPTLLLYKLYNIDNNDNKTVFEVSMIDANSKFKFIYNLYFNYMELYNLNDDPLEKNNLIDEQQQIADKMLQKIQDTLFLKI